jgi:hypothetical protein
LMCFTPRTQIFLFIEQESRFRNTARYLQF